MTPQVTLSAIAVGELIREQIAAEAVATPEPPHKLKNMPPPSPGPQLFEDENGVPFGIASIYLGKTVHRIVRCKLIPGKQEGIYEDGYIYPVNKNGKIIRLNGTISNLKWNEFRNNYTFSSVTVTTVEKTPAQKEATKFTYTKEEEKLKKTAGKSAHIGYYNDVIDETIRHCLSNRNITILKSKNVPEKLRENNFWFELGTIEDNDKRFDNTTMGSTIWKYKDKWIISSHSAYLKLDNKTGY